MFLRLRARFSLRAASSWIFMVACCSRSSTSSLWSLTTSRSELAKRPVISSTRSSTLVAWLRNWPNSWFRAATSSLALAR
ncbi:hypothetical protein D3C87_2096750 [compost metagenome]